MVKKTITLLLAMGLLLFSQSCKTALQDETYTDPVESMAASSKSYEESSEPASSSEEKTASESGELQALEKSESEMEPSSAQNAPEGEVNFLAGGITEGVSQGDSAASYEEQEESFAAELPAAAYAKQIVAVVSDGSSAVVSMHEKDENGVWRELLSTNGFVGSAGVGQASESVSRTPRGTYSLTQAFGIQKDPGTDLPYIQVDSSHYWVDDPSSSYYNRLVSTNDVARNWNSAEHLVDASPAYDYAVVIDYNTDCVPGSGSAFFLHCSTGAPTAGCVAVPENDMLFILQNLSEDAYIVIGPQEDFQ